MRAGRFFSVDTSSKHIFSYHISLGGAKLVHSLFSSTFEYDMGQWFILHYSLLDLFYYLYHWTKHVSAIRYSAIVDIFSAVARTTFLHDVHLLTWISSLRTVRTVSSHLRTPKGKLHKYFCQWTSVVFT